MKTNSTHLARRPKDLYAGLVFLTVGLVIFFAAQEYEVGAASRMGPGYLPALAGAFLVFLGGCSLFTALRTRSPEPIAREPWEPFLLVVASVVAFGLLIDWAGFVIAMAALIFLSCLRRVRKHPWEVLAIYVGLTAFCVGVFRFALNMPLPLWW